MKSIREQALCQVIELLNVEASPAQNVFRSKLDQIEQSQVPCFDVSPGDEKMDDPGEFGDHGSITRTLEVSVRALIDAADEGRALDVPDAIIDDSALDPFYVFAVQRLCSGQANLNGIVISVEEMEGRTVFQPTGRDLIGLEMTFKLTWATKRGDPTQKG
jgi:hypothetical protein